MCIHYLYDNKITMGNCVRREVGFEVEDETNAPPAPEIIDKIVLMKKKIFVIT